MGRLVNYGLGELSDRLSILSLKILFGADPESFKAEKAALLVQLRTRTVNAQWFEAYTDLAAVNAALWHAEDDLRQLRNGTAERPVVIQPDAALDLAFRIQELNDRRAALVAQINKEAGDGDHKEKV